MNLTDTISTIRGIDRKTGATLNETLTAVSVANDENSSRGPQLLRELKGLTGQRALLRVRVARALTAHPDVVAALAAYQVALMRQKLLQDVIPRPLDQSWGTVYTSEAAAFQALFDRAALVPTGPFRRRTCRTVRSGVPEPLATELLARKEQAGHQVLEAQVTLATLSAAVELSGRDNGT